MVLPRGVIWANPFGSTVPTRHTLAGKAVLMCSWRTLGMVANRASSVRPLEIVDGVVAPEPALELRVRVGVANRVDLLDVRRVDREFDAQPVGARRIERHAVAVIGLTARDAGGGEPSVDLVEGLPVDLEGDVLEAADLRIDGLRALVHLRVGELEERQRAAVGQAEERVAIVDLALDLGVEGPLAPGRHQRQPQDVLEELPVHLMVADDEGVVMKSLREIIQMTHGRRLPAGLSRAPSRMSTGGAGLIRRHGDAKLAIR